MLILIGLVWVTESSLLSQQKATSQDASELFGLFTGTVKDSVIGIPLVGATVELKPGQRGDASDLVGHFEVPRIHPGRYSFSFSYVGYKTVTVNDVEIAAGKITHLDISLPWSSPPDFSDWARRELSQGIVRLWTAGLLIGSGPDSMFTSQYGFQYVDVGCDPTGVLEHNRVVEEFLEGRNGKGWKEHFVKDWYRNVAGQNNK
jgi:hypothetical protein